MVKVRRGTRNNAYGSSIYGVVKADSDTQNTGFTVARSEPCRSLLKNVKLFMKLKSVIQPESLRVPIIHVGRRVPKHLVELSGSIHLGRGIWMFRCALKDWACLEPVKDPTADGLLSHHNSSIRIKRVKIPDEVKREISRALSDGRHP